MVIANFSLSLAAGAVLVAVVTGCGGNVCTSKEERVADCLGSDSSVEDVPDEQCPAVLQKEAECILDKSCEDINSGQAYEDCATKPK